MTVCTLFIVNRYVLFAQRERTLNVMLSDFSRTCEEFGLKINVKETKSVVVSRMHSAQVKVANEEIGCSYRTSLKTIICPITSGEGKREL